MPAAIALLAVLVALVCPPATSAEGVVPSNSTRSQEVQLASAEFLFTMIPTAVLVVACALKYASLKLFPAPPAVAAAADERPDASATPVGDMTMPAQLRPQRRADTTTSDGPHHQQRNTIAPPERSSADAEHGEGVGAVPLLARTRSRRSLRAWTRMEMSQLQRAMARNQAELATLRRQRRQNCRILMASIERQAVDYLHDQRTLEVPVDEDSVLRGVRRLRRDLEEMDAREIRELEEERQAWATRRYMPPRAHQVATPWTLMRPQQHWLPSEVHTTERQLHRRTPAFTRSNSRR